MKIIDMSIKVLIMGALFAMNSFSTFSENWELFPYNTKFWCQNQDGKIFSFKADSIISEGFYMMNTKNMDSISLHCYDSIYKNINDWYYNNSEPIKIKVSENTQMITYAFDVQLEIQPLIDINASYTQNTGNEYYSDKVTISCISASVENIYGFQDSTKEFSIKFKYGSQNLSKFKISKNYGILSFINIDYDEYKFQEYQVVGYESENLNYGYKPEDIKIKLLNWNIGDIRTILDYQYIDYPKSIKTKFYLDSVINITKRDDITNIHFKRFYLDSNEQTIEKEIITETYNLEDFNIYYNEYYELVISKYFDDNFGSDKWIYLTSGTDLSIEYSLDSIKILEMFRSFYSMDPNCRISISTDIHCYRRLALGFGLVKTSYHKGLDFSYLELCGYRQGKKTWGITSLTTDIERNIFIKEQIFISPNPSSDYITINLSAINRRVNPTIDGNMMIEIYDMMGVLVAQTFSSVFNGQTGTSAPPKIDVSNLTPGVYFVKIVGSNGASSIVEKFVKI